MRTASKILLLAIAVLAPARAASAGPDARQPMPATGPDAWQAVPAVDLAALSPADFADEELFLATGYEYAAGVLDLGALTHETAVPYYLAHFKTLAEAVRPDGPKRGFIDLSVWRAPQFNKPHNARIMESCLSLIWFYTADRKWNPYRGHPAVRQRLEAALEYWLGMQDPQGRFSEYGSGQWNLAASAFATKFMGEGLLLLAGGPAIDAELHKRVAAAQRKAVLAVLTRDDFWKHGMAYTNQYENVWCGALAHLKLNPDDREVREQFTRRWAQAKEAFQSPAGYMYEAGGPDWGYNFGTHHSNIRMAWTLARQMNLADLAGDLEREHRLWIEWLSYNAVPEPDGSLFLLNRAIETRTSHDRFAQLNTPLAQTVEGARAFAASRGEHQQRLRLARQRTAAAWPAIAKLRVGEHMGYSPYAFLHLRHPNYYPTDAERDAARRALPYLARERFVHQRVDPRTPLTVSYVRRPSYYAIFNAGPGRAAHRYGLGLLWHPRTGTFLQQPTGKVVSKPAWGTRIGKADVLESRLRDVQYRMDGQPFTPETGNRDRDGRTLAVRYALGDKGSKTVTFLADRIEVRVEHPGTFSEELPFVARAGDRAAAKEGVLTVSRNGMTLEVRLAGEGVIGLEPRDGCHHARVAARDKLAYTIRIMEK